MASNFNHALNKDFIKALEVEATKEGWWADVLKDPKPPHLSARQLSE